MLIPDAGISDIQDFLESVTGDCYRRRIIENTPQTLLLAFESDAHVDYLIHVMSRRGQYRLAFAVARLRDIETRFDRSLNPLQFQRLISDPRLCVMYMVGQIYD